jgi:hypothetical protein
MSTFLHFVEKLSHVFSGAVETPCRIGSLKAYPIPQLLNNNQVRVSRHASEVGQMSLCFKRTRKKWSDNVTACVVAASTN